jgi:hypothetical protein
LAVLFYDEYESQKEVDDFIAKHQDKIQCVVGKKYIPFGQAQKPAIDDFADGVDVMEFLGKI